MAFIAALYAGCTHGCLAMYSACVLLGWQLTSVLWLHVALLALPLPKQMKPREGQRRRLHRGPPRQVPTPSTPPGLKHKS